jgi:uncharacterized SAM-binding protein YcdF (DUF218 family)
MRNRITIPTLLLLLAIALFLGRVPILRAAGHFLVVDQDPQPADAILVLSGSVPDRILEAVELYQGGFAPLIVLCGEPENEGSRQLRERGVTLPRVHELNVSVAVQLGVPASAIAVVDRPPGSTFTEALVILDYLAARGAKSILLVTSQYHTRRAGVIYRHLAGAATKIITRPARTGGFDPDRWWHDRMSVRRLLIEYQKLVLFQLWDRWKIGPRVHGEAEFASPSPSASRR